MTDAAAHNEAHAEPNYLAVFGWLFVLTVIEVGVIFLPIPKLMIAASLVILAVVKASTGGHLLHAPQVREGRDLVDRGDPPPSFASSSSSC